MPEELYKKINEEISKRFRRKKRPVQYLMELLSISKESAYRRLRGAIPYTVEDVSMIANDLDFSIDRLLGSKNRIDCNFFDKPYSEPDDFYAGMLKSNIETIENAVSLGKVSVTAVLNRIPLYFLPSKMLFKFEYAGYLHARNNLSFKDNFSTINFPQEMVELHEKFLNSFAKMNSITCIIDGDIFSNIIKKIKYYHQLSFLTDNDLILLQKELYRLMEMFEELLRTEKSRSGTDYFFYYSPLYIESNTALIEYKDNSILQLWVYPERNPVVIQNYPLICNIQKGWINFRMRNSVLITKTNELKQGEILKRSYKLIEDLREDN